MLTDGLRAEREQGITIDVAYRYFATPKRKFIIADTPGHIQYTRNMVTGASTANLAIILVDARKGIQEQTNRHAFIASLLIGVMQSFAIAVDYSGIKLAQDIGFAVTPATPFYSLFQLTVSQVAPVLPYLLLVLILIFRPKGLLGTREG